MKELLYYNTLEDIKIMDMLRASKEEELPNLIILTIQSAGAEEVTPIFNAEANTIGNKFILDGKEITSLDFLSTGVFFGLLFEDSNEHTLKVSLLSSIVPNFQMKDKESANSITSVILSNSITEIGESAFSNCSGLTQLTIPNSVTAIGESAFFGCSGLSRINSNAITAPTVAFRTFLNVKSNGLLLIPTGSDYSTWMSTDDYYLGKYGWTIIIPH